MPKSSKRFIISDSGLNNQGFRMLTEGAIMDNFERNPVLLFNHLRPEGNHKDQILPLGYWTDIEVNEDEITGVPFFDDKDEFAMRIYDKVENDILRMCSAGAEPLETSADVSLIVPGQTRETVTKWVLVEASICDIGANPNSLATVALYGSNNTVLLSEGHETLIPKLNKPEMAKKKVKLVDDPEKKELEGQDPEEQLTDEEKDALIAQLQAEVEKLRAQLEDAQEQLQLAEEEQENEKVENLVSKAVTMKQITLAQKPHFIALAKQDFESAAKLLATMKPSATLKDMLQNPVSDESDARVAELAKEGYDELFKNGGLAYLKLHAPELYKEKHKSKYGKYPQNI